MGRKYIDKKKASPHNILFLISDFHPYLLILKVICRFQIPLILRLPCTNFNGHIRLKNLFKSIKKGQTILI